MFVERTIHKKNMYFKSISEKQKERWTKFFSLMFIFLFELIGTLNIVSIMNNSSEYNVIAMAAGFAGYDWESTILKSHYYGYTASILFALVFFIKPLVDNSYLLLHSLLLINVLLNVACAYILYEIVFKMLYINTKKKYYVQTSFITIAISLFLSSQVLTKSVTNENLFVLCCYITVYILMFGNESTDRKSLCINSIVLAVCNVVGYATNGRGIIWICITILTFIVFYFLKCEKIGYASVYLVCLIGFFLLSVLMKNQIEDMFYFVESGTITEMKNNDVQGIIERAFKLINVTGVKLYIKLVIGWGTYFIVSTYGIGIVAIVAAIQNVYKKVKKKEEISNCIFAISLITIFFMLGMTVLGICFYYDSFFAMNYDGESSLANGRVDKLIYGRYISTIKGPIIALGIYELFFNIKTKKEKIQMYLLYTLIYGGFAAAFLIWIQKRMVGKRYAAVDIPEFALFFGELEKNYKFGIVEEGALLKIIIIFGFVLCVVLLLNWFERNEFIVLFVIILNVFFGVEYNEKMMIPRSEYYQSEVQMEYISYIKNEESENALVVTDSNAYLYQFYLPDAKVVSSQQALLLELEDYAKVYIFAFDNEQLLCDYTELFGNKSNVEIIFETM